MEVQTLQLKGRTMLILFCVCAPILYLWLLSSCKLRLVMDSGLVFIVDCQSNTGVGITHLPAILPSPVRGSNKFGCSPMRESLSFATSSNIIFMSGYSKSTSWKCGEHNEYRLQRVAARTEATRRASLVKRHISRK